MHQEKKIELIEIDKIKILNPRVRDKKKFKQIVKNISKVGLKKPITVSPNGRTENGKILYDLVCGQGRLEAFVELGETEIPAIVSDVPEEDRLLMSLIENLARRNPLKFEHVIQVAALKEKGYTTSEIAEKISLSKSYVEIVLRLWTKGDEHLLQAVDRGIIPISIAIQIVNASTDEAIQHALMEAYKEKKLKGSELNKIRKFIKMRKEKETKYLRKSIKKNNKRNLSRELVRAFEQETQRQQLFVKKARLFEIRLTFIVTALRKLYEDQNFVNLLSAEKLNTLPQFLGEQITKEG